MAYLQSCGLGSSLDCICTQTSQASDGNTDRFLHLFIQTCKYFLGILQHLTVRAHSSAVSLKTAFHRKFLLIFYLKDVFLGALLDVVIFGRSGSADLIVELMTLKVFSNINYTMILVGQPRSLLCLFSFSKWLCIFPSGISSVVMNTYYYMEKW